MTYAKHFIIQEAGLMLHGKCGEGYDCGSICRFDDGGK